MYLIMLIGIVLLISKFISLVIDFKIICHLKKIFDFLFPLILCTFRNKIKQHSIQDPILECTLRKRGSLHSIICFYSRRTFIQDVIFRLFHFWRMCLDHLDQYMLHLHILMKLNTWFKFIMHSQGSDIRSGLCYDWISIMNWKATNITLH